MRKTLERKVKETIVSIRQIYPKLKSRYPFIAFSTGKDSLAMAAMIYEAVTPEKPPCVYVHHSLEFPTNLDYLAELKDRGFEAEVVHPFLEYFELTERGIGFLTLVDPWCVPMLVGTGLLNWLKRKGARGPKEGVMFRGMSGSEYSHKFHSGLELYSKLDLPCFNPLLDFRKEEIIEIIKERYGLPLNPIYQYMNRTYCICCYTSDKRRQAYSEKHYPQVCKQYYKDIEQKLFDSGLIDKSNIAPEYKTRQEKLQRHGFIYWRRHKEQDIIGAVKYRLPSGGLVYHIRESKWIVAKHLKPLDGKWAKIGNEIRFWDVPEKTADTVIKRMINCLDCGFCMVECFPCRQFDQGTKTLRIESCIQCGKCLRLKFCMGWRHRFWRRVIVDGS
jgi:3'-phosphoadenosine 5'-phosphosulfate sulfotransferase (PAPS reductase)/FAD synthetase/NAD-dependent dihydropyrimidine dehydrogenase PreA subunit